MAHGEDSQTPAELKLMVIEQMLALGLPVPLDDVLIVGEGDSWSLHLARPYGKVFDLSRISALSKIERVLRERYTLAEEPR